MTALESNAEWMRRRGIKPMPAEERERRTVHPTGTIEERKARYANAVAIVAASMTSDPAPDGV